MDLVQMPLEKFAVGPVDRLVRRRNSLAGAGVELFAVPELLAQARADQ